MTSKAVRSAPAIASRPLTEKEKAQADFEVAMAESEAWAEHAVLICDGDLEKLVDTSRAWRKRLVKVAKAAKKFEKTKK